MVGNALARVSLTLPGSTPAPVDGQLAAGRYVYVSLAAPQFTATGDCRSDGSLRLIAPKIFELAIANLTFTAENHDTMSAQNQVLRGCDGRMLVENIRLAG